MVSFESLIFLGFGERLEGKTHFKEVFLFHFTVMNLRTFTLSVFLKMRDLGGHEDMFFFWQLEQCVFSTCLKNGVSTPR